jgi:hypothetical protein
MLTKEKSVGAMSDDELEVELVMLWANKQLTQVRYNELICELQRRQIPAESMATLVGVGQPAWQKPYRS